MPLPGAADDAAPTLRNEHGLYAVRKEAIGKTAIHAGHSKPDRFVALKFKQRSQFRKAEAGLANEVVGPATDHGVEMCLDCRKDTRRHAAEQDWTQDLDGARVAATLCDIDGPLTARVLEHPPGP